MSKYERHQIAYHSTVINNIKKGKLMRQSKINNDGTITLKNVKFNKRQSEVVSSTVTGALFLGASIVGLIWWICA